jgi:2-polyprenyl-3-methyl-5-hydroxy-6-metoxy-1,4-benzoquinol methylase/uncharacterized protein YbaR (Trm112 family)
LHEYSLKHLRCIKCLGRLEADILRQDFEIEEGFLYCKNCSAIFTIINKIAILRDLANYLSVRPRLGGELVLVSRTDTMKSFVKKALTQIKRGQKDLSIIEKRWAQIYAKNRGSKFYTTIKNAFDSANLTGTVMEHGCSIGIIAEYLAKSNMHVFGIDRSYYALTYAKKSDMKNLDYFVADSQEHPFGRSKFDMVVALNLFELIEPAPLLKLLSRQVAVGGLLVISDPYDYERGESSVKMPLREDLVRAELEKNGLAVTKDTTKPSFIPWTLKLYDRAVLQYKVDLIIGKNTRKRHTAKIKSF